MLKRQFSLQESLAVRDYVLKISEGIKIEAEKALLKNIVFQNRPRKIRCISYDHDWIMKPDYKVVSDAITSLSGTVSELKIQTFRDPVSIHLKTHMIYLLGCLKTGLAMYGRKEVLSFDTNTVMSEEKTIKLAKDIIGLNSAPEK